MKKIILFIIIFSLPLNSLANELQTRKNIDRQVKDLLLGREYAKLESMADQFRSEESRTSSGLWMLTSFYASFYDMGDDKEGSSQNWRIIENNVDSWIRSHPNSPTPYIVKSLVLRNEAWRIRGNGYASTVKTEAWKPFHEKIEQSRKVLIDSRAVSKPDPHWYVVMANIATEQSWNEEKFKALVEEGLAENKYYFQLYFDIMRYYTPKWRGSAEQIEAFATKAVEQTKEREGFGMYARIYWAASQSQFEGRLFENSNVRWDVMRKGIDDVLKKYPDQWNINNFALFSCLAKDKQKTNEIISMIEGRPIKSGWLGNLQYYDYCKRWSQG